MNLIQIKQIDGLQDALNSLSTSIYDVDQDIKSELEDFDDYWGQFYWTEDRVELNSGGSTSNGRDGIALDISAGGLRVYADSYFESELVVEGNSYFRSLVSGGSLICEGSAEVGGNLEVSCELNVAGNINATSSIGQIKYLNNDGQQVSLANVMQSNYSGVSSSPAELSLDNHIVGVKTSSVGEECSLVLPPPSSSKQIIIKDEDFTSSTYNISVSPNSSESIDGQIGFTITGNGGFAQVYSNGVDWFLYGSSGISI